MSRMTLAALTALALAQPATAEASCMCMFREFDTNLADDPKNPSTAVFLLRDGTRTVLTIEPAYEGPAAEISMIVPLPSPITRDDVRTISGHHFRRVDRATAPRLRHSWESCPRRTARRRASRGRSAGVGIVGGGDGEALGVEIEERWDVDEYDVSLLSASESAGLLTFLRERGLRLPDRAEPVLRSYIETGHRFAFVRADPTRAEVVGGRMVLSPLQLHYDSEELRVPVRLGTLNSPGEQELLLYVLSREGRYEVANRETLEAPRGASLREGYEGGFPAFYGGLMDELFRRHPGSAVTEYVRTLGGFHDGARVRQTYWFGLDRHVARTSSGQPAWRDFRRWTLTRIRHRYGTELDDDLVLRPTGAETHGTAADLTVRFEVRHAGACPGIAARRALAQQWADSGSLWSSEARAWPGDALTEPLLGIEPGSEPPPPPAAVIAVDAPTVEPAAPPEPSPPALPVPVAEPARAAAGCAVTSTVEDDGAPFAWLALLGAATLAGRRGRRRRLSAAR